MGKRAPLSLGLLVFWGICTSVGCAYQIHTVGARNPEAPSQLTRETTLSVVKAPGSDETAWDQELTAKLERLLERDGYVLARSAEADYYLFFDYRIKALVERVGLELIHGTSTGMETVRKGGPFVHTLALRVVDAASYRRENTEEIIWQGGAVMSDVPTEGPSFHDLVLVAAFDKFGQDTPDTATVKMSRNDSRARRLRSP